MEARAFGCFCAVLLCQLGFSKDLQVPKQYATIQSAIDAANTGDRVLVATGVYTGAGNVDLDFHGKAITVEGNGYLSTVIDCQGDSRGFTFSSSEGASSIVRSLTIRNGLEAQGGAIAIIGSSPTFVRCSVEDCKADNGGAVYISGGQPSFQTTQFKHDSSSLGGGAIYSDGASPGFIGCTFAGNDTRGLGGAIRADGGNTSFISCVFQENNSDFGGGAFAGVGSRVKFVNSSFSENVSFQNGGAIDLSSGSGATISNCTLAANLSHRGAGGVRIADTSSARIGNSILWSDAPMEFQG